VTKKLPLQEEPVGRDSGTDDSRCHRAQETGSLTDTGRQITVSAGDLLDGSGECSIRSALTKM
jgi:hypothetical protein